jgi:hypothetical protein
MEVREPRPHHSSGIDVVFTNEFKIDAFLDQAAVARAAFADGDRRAGCM